MKIGIRVDANTDIGQGHVMRCFAIADYAEKNNIFETVFLISDENTEIIMKNRRKKYIILYSDYKCYSFIEANRIKNLINTEEIDILLIDSYYITEEYINILSGLLPIACFFYKEKVIGADLVINYNINFNKKFYRKNYKKDNKTSLLLGTSYVPLREEFYVDKQKIMTNDNGNKILFLSGGSDPYGISIIAEKMAMCFPQYEIVLVCGQYNIKSNFCGLPDNMIVINNTNNISSLMRESNLIISASGMTMYEICALGVPAIIYSMADNQIEEAQYMEKKGCVKYVGDIRNNKNFEQDICCKIKYLLSHNRVIKRMKKRMRSIINGNGCKKIVEGLLELEKL